jgi:predicted DNA-binding antitoxin AbrB/MazE fold protein
MYAIEAIFDGTTFRPLQPIPIKEDYKVVITFLTPIKKEAVRPPFEFDSMADEIWMADDFDAPLADFKEYME